MTGYFVGGIFVPGDFCRRDFCPGGFFPEGFLWLDFFRGDFTRLPIYMHADRRTEDIRTYIYIRTKMREHV